jgi:S1-C subfamily serine protease
MSRSALLWPIPLALVLCTFIMAQPGQRPLLGVAVSPADENGEGVQIREVTPDSPAAKAGLKAGDVVTRLDGKAVEDVAAFLRGVGAKKPGDVLALDVRRGDKQLTVKATLGQSAGGTTGGGQPSLPPNLKELGRPAFLGVQVQELTPELRKQLGVKAEVGAVVEQVVPSSPAARAGLKHDDVITAVDGKVVKNAADLRALVQNAGANKDVMLRVQRGGEQKDIKVALASGPPSGFGGFEPLVPGGKMPFDIESMWDQSGRVRKLQERVDMLEKRVRELEKQLGAKKQ